MSLLDKFKTDSTGGRIPENTEIREIDEFGKPKVKNSEQQAQAKPQGKIRGSMQSTKGKIGWGLGIFILFIILMYRGGSLADFVDMFSATPQENMNSMFQSIRDMEKVNKQNGQMHPIYDRHNIYHDDVLLEQVEKEYVVYLYTQDTTLDAPFNAWVEENEGVIPIYKLNVYSVKNPDLSAIIPFDEPSFVLVREIERGNKVVDTVVVNESEFDTIPIILQTLKEYRQNQGKN